MTPSLKPTAKKSFSKRVLAAFLIVTFLTSDQFQALSFAASAPETIRKAAVIPQGNLPKIPSSLGRIEHFFQGQSPYSVLLIQDAHAVPDAQRGISRLIRHFQKKYGVRSVALEGASEDLDPRFFRSFPDKKKLKEVFRAYHERGELAGGTAAAIFGPGETVYRGVEDWNLYEEGVLLYLQALEQEKTSLEAIAVLRQKIEKRQQETNSKELLELDSALDRFYRNEIPLTEILEKLAAVKKPDPQSEIGILYGKIAGNGKKDEALALEIKNLAVAAGQELKAGISKPRGQQKWAAFNTKYQEYLTGHYSPESFAAFLKPFLTKKLRATISEKLQAQIDLEKRVLNIRGSDFFNQLENYAHEAKETLFRNDEHRALDFHKSRLRLLERFAKLEISHQDWVALGDWSAGKPIPIRNGIRLPQDATSLDESESEILRSMELPRAFYENALQREKVLFENLRKMLSEQSPSAVFVAGGFHAEGMARLMREAGISYHMIMPSMRHIPEETNYQSHMRGEVSWKDYLKPEKDGRIPVYDNFMRATRDRLLASSVERVADRSEKSFDPNELYTLPAVRSTLKTWRDELIRDLAKTGEIERAGEYTRFLDEIVPVKRSAAHEAMMTAAAKFVEGLNLLHQKNEYTPEKITGLLNRSGSLAIWTGTAPAQRNSRAFDPRKLPRSGLATRAEARTVSALSVDKEIGIRKTGRDEYKTLAKRAEKLAERTREGDHTYDQLANNLFARVRFLLLKPEIQGDIWIAEKGTEILGFRTMNRLTQDWEGLPAQVVPLLEEGVTEGITVVAPEHQGEHIGSRLLSSALQDLRDGQGSRYFMMTLSPKNKPAFRAAHHVIYSQRLKMIHLKDSDYYLIDLFPENPVIARPAGEIQEVSESLEEALKHLPPQEPWEMTPEEFLRISKEGREESEKLFFIEAVYKVWKGKLPIGEFTRPVSWKQSPFAAFSSWVKEAIASRIFRLIVVQLPHLPAEPDMQKMAFYRPAGRSHFQQLWKIYEDMAARQQEMLGRGIKPREAGMLSFLELLAIGRALGQSEKQIIYRLSLEYTHETILQEAYRAGYKIPLRVMREHGLFRHAYQLHVREGARPEIRTVLQTTEPKPLSENLLGADTGLPQANNDLSLANRDVREGRLYDARDYYETSLQMYWEAGRHADEKVREEIWRVREAIQLRLDELDNLLGPRLTARSVPPGTVAGRLAPLYGVVTNMVRAVRERRGIPVTARLSLFDWGVGSGQGIAGGFTMTELSTHLIREAGISEIVNTGIDSDSRIVAQAQEDQAELHRGLPENIRNRVTIRVVHGDFDRPLEAGLPKADVLIIANVLKHYYLAPEEGYRPEEYAKVIARLQSELSDDGILIVAESRPLKDSEFSYADPGRREVSEIKAVYFKTTDPLRPLTPEEVINGPEISLMGPPAESLSLQDIQGQLEPALDARAELRALRSPEENADKILQNMFQLIDRWEPAIGPTRDGREERIRNYVASLSIATEKIKPERLYTTVLSQLIQLANRGYAEYEIRQLITRLTERLNPEQQVPLISDFLEQRIVGYAMMIIAEKVGKEWFQELFREVLKIVESEINAYQAKQGAETLSVLILRRLKYKRAEVTALRPVLTELLKIIINSNRMNLSTAVELLEQEVLIPNKGREISFIEIRLRGLVEQITADRDSGENREAPESFLKTGSGPGISKSEAPAPDLRAEARLKTPQDIAEEHLNIIREVMEVKSGKRDLDADSILAVSNQKFRSAAMRMPPEKLRAIFWEDILGLWDPNGNYNDKQLVHDLVFFMAQHMDESDIPDLLNDLLQNKIWEDALALGAKRLEQPRAGEFRDDFVKAFAADMGPNGDGSGLKALAVLFLRAEGYDQDEVTALLPLTRQYLRGLFFGKKLSSEELNRLAEEVLRPGKSLKQEVVLIEKRILSFMERDDSERKADAGESQPESFLKEPRAEARARQDAPEIIGNILMFLRKNGVPAVSTSQASRLIDLMRALDDTMPRVSSQNLRKLVAQDLIEALILLRKDGLPDSAYYQSVILQHLITIANKLPPEQLMFFAYDFLDMKVIAVPLETIASRISDDKLPDLRKALIEGLRGMKETDVVNGLRHIPAMTGLGKPAIYYGAQALARVLMRLEGLKLSEISVKAFGKLLVTLILNNLLNEEMLGEINEEVLSPVKTLKGKKAEPRLLQRLDAFQEQVEGDRGHGGEEEDPPAVETFLQTEPGPRISRARVFDLRAEIRTKDDFTDLAATIKTLVRQRDIEMLLSQGPITLEILYLNQDNPKLSSEWHIIRSRGTQVSNIAFFDTPLASILRAAIPVLEKWKPTAVRPRLRYTAEAKVESRERKVQVRITAARAEVRAADEAPLTERQLWTNRGIAGAVLLGAVLGFGTMISRFNRWEQEKARFAQEVETRLVANNADFRERKVLLEKLSEEYDRNIQPLLNRVEKIRRDLRNLENRVTEEDGWGDSVDTIIKRINKEMKELETALRDADIPVELNEMKNFSGEVNISHFIGAGGYGTSAAREITAAREALTKAEQAINDSGAGLKAKRDAERDWLNNQRELEAARLKGLTPERSELRIYNEGDKRPNRLPDPVQRALASLRDTSDLDFYETVSKADRKFEGDRTGPEYPAAMHKVIQDYLVQEHRVFIPAPSGVREPGWPEGKTPLQEIAFLYLNAFDVSPLLAEDYVRNESDYFSNVVADYIQKIHDNLEETVEALLDRLDRNWDSQYEADAAELSSLMSFHAYQLSDSSLEPLLEKHKRILRRFTAPSAYSAKSLHSVMHSLSKLAHRAFKKDGNAIYLEYLDQILRLNPEYFKSPQLRLNFWEPAMPKVTDIQRYLKILEKLAPYSQDSLSFRVLQEHLQTRVKTNTLEKGTYPAAYALVLIKALSLFPVEKLVPKTEIAQEMTAYYESVATTLEFFVEHAPLEDVPEIAKAVLEEWTRVDQPNVIRKVQVELRRELGILLIRMIGAERRSSTAAKINAYIKNKDLKAVDVEAVLEDFIHASTLEAADREAYALRRLSLRKEQADGEVGRGGSDPEAPADVESFLRPATRAEVRTGQPEKSGEPLGSRIVRAALGMASEDLKPREFLSRKTGLYLAMGILWLIIGAGFGVHFYRNPGQLDMLLRKGRIAFYQKGADAMEGKTSLAQWRENFLSNSNEAIEKQHEKYKALVKQHVVQVLQIPEQDIVRIYTEGGFSGRVFNATVGLKNRMTLQYEEKQSGVLRVSAVMTSTIDSLKLKREAARLNAEYGNETYHEATVTGVSEFVKTLEAWDKDLSGGREIGGIEFFEEMEGSIDGPSINIRIYPETADNLPALLKAISSKSPPADELTGILQKKLQSGKSFILLLAEVAPGAFYLQMYEAPQTRPEIRTLAQPESLPEENAKKAIESLRSQGINKQRDAFVAEVAQRITDAYTSTMSPQRYMELLDDAFRRSLSNHYQIEPGSLLTSKRESAFIFSPDLYRNALVGSVYLTNPRSVADTVVRIAMYDTKGQVSDFLVASLTKNPMGEKSKILSNLAAYIEGTVFGARSEARMQDFDFSELSPEKILQAISTEDKAILRDIVDEMEEALPQLYLWSSVDEEDEESVRKYTWMIQNGQLGFVEWGVLREHGLDPKYEEQTAWGVIAAEWRRRIFDRLDAFKDDAALEVDLKELDSDAAFFMRHGAKEWQSPVTEHLVDGFMSALKAYINLYIENDSDLTPDRKRQLLTIWNSYAAKLSLRSKDENNAHAFLKWKDAYLDADLYRYLKGEVEVDEMNERRKERSARIDKLVTGNLEGIDDWLSDEFGQKTSEMVSVLNDIAEEMDDTKPFDFIPYFERGGWWTAIEEVWKDASGLMNFGEITDLLPPLPGWYEFFVEDAAAKGMFLNMVAFFATKLEEPIETIFLKIAELEENGLDPEIHYALLLSVLQELVQNPNEKYQKAALDFAKRNPKYGRMLYYLVAAQVLQPLSYDEGFPLLSQVKSFTPESVDIIEKYDSDGKYLPFYDDLRAFARAEVRVEISQQDLDRLKTFLMGKYSSVKNLDKKLTPANLKALLELETLDASGVTRILSGVNFKGNQAGEIASQIKAYKISKIKAPDSPWFMMKWFARIYVPATQFLDQELTGGSMTGQDFKDWLNEILRPLAPQFQFGNFSSDQILEVEDIRDFGERVLREIFLPRNFFFSIVDGRPFYAPIIKITDRQTPGGRTVKVYEVDDPEVALGEASASAGYITLSSAVEQFVRSEYATYHEQWLAIQRGDQNYVPFEEDPSMHFKQRLLLENIGRHDSADSGVTIFQENALAEEFSHSDGDDFVVRLKGDLEEGLIVERVMSRGSSVLRHGQTLERTLTAFRSGYFHGIPAEDQPLLQGVLGNTMLQQFQGAPHEIQIQFSGLFAESFFELEAKINALIHSPSPAYSLLEPIFVLFFQEGEVPANNSLAYRFLLAMLGEEFFGRPTAFSEDWLPFLESRIQNLDAFNEEIRAAAARIYPKHFLSYPEREEAIRFAGKMREKIPAEHHAAIPAWRYHQLYFLSEQNDENVLRQAFNEWTPSGQPATSPEIVDLLVASALYARAELRQEIPVRTEVKTPQPEKAAAGFKDWHENPSEQSRTALVGEVAGVTKEKFQAFAAAFLAELDKLEIAGDIDAEYAAASKGFISMLVALLDKVTGKDTPVTLMLGVPQQESDATRKSFADTHAEALAKLGPANLEGLFLDGRMDQILQNALETAGLQKSQLRPVSNTSQVKVDKKVQAGLPRIAERGTSAARGAKNLLPILLDRTGAENADIFTVASAVFLQYFVAYIAAKELTAGEFELLVAAANGEEVNADRIREVGDKLLQVLYKTGYDFSALVSLEQGMPSIMVKQVQAFVTAHKAQLAAASAA